MFLLFSAAASGANFLGVIFNFLTTRIIFDPVLAVQPGLLERLNSGQTLTITVSAVAFPAVFLIAYLHFLPTIRFARFAPGEAPDELIETVRRRAINTPILFALLAAIPWLAGPTIGLVGAGYDAISIRISTNGYMAGGIAVIASLFLTELVLRYYLAPRVFPEGRLRQVRGTVRLRLLTRMLLLAAAISFLPIVYYHLLLNAGAFQIAIGVDGAVALRNLSRFSALIAPIFILMSIGLTLVLARSFSTSLVAMETATEEIENGRYDRRIRVVSNDEIGVLGDAMNTMLGGLRDRARILDQFGRLVDPRIRDYLLGDPALLAGRRKQVVVFFSDIRQFTTLSERLPPEEVFALLNRHFTDTARIIAEYGGHVDKFIGDAVMAVFGLFDDRDPAVHCRLALDACLAIRAELERFNAARAAAGRDFLRIGMGLHTGLVLAGKLGSEERFDYTIIGDTVNVASRVEALTKKFETDLIVTDEVLTAAGATARASHLVQVRGREGGVRVHLL